MMTNEKLAAAALRVGTETYTGRTHFMAMRKIIELPDIDKSTIADMAMQAEDGFVTDTGRFVDRHEAFEIAVAAGQIAPESAHLSDPLANMAFYNTAKPSLDSGMMESYAPMRVRRANVY